MTYKKYTIVATLALIAIGLPTAVFADFVDDTCSDYRGLKRVACNEVQGLWAQVNQNTSDIQSVNATAQANAVAIRGIPDHSTDVTQLQGDMTKVQSTQTTNVGYIDTLGDRLFLLEYLQDNNVSASAVIIENNGPRVLVTVSGFPGGDTITWNEVTASCLDGTGVIPQDGSDLNITSLRTVQLCGIQLGSTITLAVKDTSIVDPNTARPLTLFTEVTYNP